MKTLKLYEMFNSNTLRNRSTALSIIRIMSKSKSSDEILLDFENIVFVSRSFAHELLTNLKRQNIKFRFVNTNDEINRMFKVATIKPQFSFSSPIKKKILVKM